MGGFEDANVNEWDKDEGAAIDTSRQTSGDEMKERGGTRRGELFLSRRWEKRSWVKETCSSLRTEY